MPTATTDNRPTIAERQAIKRAERRAKLGLPPVPTCTPGSVTRGCTCVQCDSLRDARMTYKQRRRISIREHNKRNADHVDGYDRDNLGESPDW